MELYLGKLLKALRSYKQLSAKEVADALHVSRSTYCRFEADKKVVDSVTLESLASFYDTSVDDLLDWQNMFEDPAFPYNVFKQIIKNRKENSAE